MNLQMARLDTLHSRSIDLIRKAVPKEQLVSQLKLDDLNWVNAETGKVDPTVGWAMNIGPFYDELAATIRQ